MPDAAQAPYPAYRRGAIRQNIAAFWYCRMRRKRLIRPTGEAPSGKTLNRFGIAGCGASALSGLQAKRWQGVFFVFPTPCLTFILSAKIVHHFPLTVNDSVTYSIAFFYICLKLFLRYLWLKLAFYAVRFNVHGINRSDMQH
ncbi:hypothetical protein [Citrobacter portucalensis]|uniref:hypothetical protein n=1 Tax=Citrobacter portucalensis TaxID=1639133 RepID=UPI002550784E|nr:hypothetical protein [Citrobacter portucalensis]WOR30253.1 hypothetical protein R2X24_00990 [Citrobacter portucalensis]